MKIHPYQFYLKKIANKLRKNMTTSEILLWNKLKNKQMMGYDFDRQKPILNFVVDFFCKEMQLAIEIDGSSHEDKHALDLIRQKEIEALGVHFLRFDDMLVKHDIYLVLYDIEEWIKENGFKSKN